jgi:hypothetical protein
MISAMQIGVHADYVSDVVTLAKTLVSEDVDMNQAIEKVVEKYPHFKQQQEFVQEKNRLLPLVNLKNKLHPLRDQWLEALKTKG